MQPQSLAPGGTGPTPWIWIVASHRRLKNEHGQLQLFTLVDEGGLRAAAALGLQPVSFPLVPTAHLLQRLDRVDGVFLGGSSTDVDPAHFGEAPARPETELDHEREAVSLPLVRLCIEHGVPLMGTCRGSHEINVALGGSLHQDLKARGGGVQHWEDPEESLEEVYAPRHAVTLVPDGALARIAGRDHLRVSSLHSQGVRQLGKGLVAEAHAEDGLIEAFRWHDEQLFAWGFQFHPEWGHEKDAAYGRIMAAFVTACRSRAARRRRQESTGPDTQEERPHPVFPAVASPGAENG
jgi:putative glutamine amidotransferase